MVSRRKFVGHALGAQTGRGDRSVGESKRHVVVGDAVDLESPRLQDHGFFLTQHVRRLQDEVHAGAGHLK